MVEKQLGHYRIIELLGKGGMGEVYLAQDRKLDRRVALKILPPDLAREEERRLRFQREAKAVAALNHPNIVTIHSVEESGGIHFFTMEYVDGDRLSERIPEEGLEASKFFEFAIPLVSAVAAAHRNGVTHRDLKPANVMVTRDGQLKVLDFGLAKLRESRPTSPDEQATALGREEVTALGHALGTAAYMSPEQAEGKVIDERSDIFSLGVILYQMATGSKPFSGDTQISMMSSILKDDPVSISDLRPGMPRRLGELIQLCLEKDAGARIQSADRLLESLLELKRDLDTGELLAREQRPQVSWKGRVRGALAAGRYRFLAGLAVLVAVLVGGFLLNRFRGSDSPVEGMDLDQRSVAVFYFQNLSGDAALDWLRAGLTDMLVTDLAQTPTLKVLSTERLHQIMGEGGPVSEGPVSFELVQEVARRTGSGTAVLGSYLKTGENWLVNLRIQDASSGNILVSRRFEGEGESSILALVDDLTRSIRESLELASLQAAQADRELASVTTDSVEAYRYYVEGMRHHEMGQDALAIAPLEKAVELDPDFAMALAKLSVAHANTGSEEKEKEYAARALKLVGRLSDRERVYIEGRFYSLDEETLDRAIEVYCRAIEQFPDHHSVRHNLAKIYLDEERYEEAIEHLEYLRREGMEFPATYGLLAGAYSQKGRYDRAVGILREYVERHPANAVGYDNLGRALLVVGEVPEAVEALGRGARLSSRPSPDLLAAYLLEENWEAARSLADQLAADESLPYAWIGEAFRAVADLYFGQVDRALNRLADLRSREGHQEEFLRLHGLLALQAEHPEVALEVVAQVRDQDLSRRIRRLLFSVSAFSRIRLDDRPGAESDAETVRNLIREIPDPEIRSLELNAFEGALAVLSGDHTTAIVRLLEAESLLPAYPGPESGFVGILYGLATAYQARGDWEEASLWYRKITEGKTARLFFPVPFVRSHYFLARCYEEMGEPERARVYDRKFLKYWADGQIDREIVEQLKARDPEWNQS